MTGVDDLLTWLRAIWNARERELDEDERVARAATVSPWEWGPAPPGKLSWGLSGPNVPFGGWILRVNDAGCPSTHDAEHIARWDPARVLRKVVTERARIKADRLMLDFLDPTEAPEGEGKYVAERAILMLAQPYADRPGFLEEWRA